MRALCRVICREADRRRQGRDHVWLCSADHGGSAAAAMRGVREGLILAHYFRGASLGEAQHLVLAPYLLGATATAQAAYEGWAPSTFAAASRAEDARRELTLFFAGNFLIADKSGHYSEGVRQARSPRRGPPRRDLAVAPHDLAMTSP